MSTTVLDGKTLKNMLIGGAEYIKINSDEINDLNVFPVPDGDTGTNMTKTLEGGISQVISDDATTITAVMGKFADGLMLGARGNSGVILSQIFAGIKDVLAKYDYVGTQELSKAYKNGISKSYASVTNPTEGTILTVFRESTEYAARNITPDSTIEDFFKLHIEEAERALARTKEQLPVLTDADVVDSGAAGYLCIAIGMYSALTGEFNADAYSLSRTASAPLPDFNLFKRDSELKYGYCTEFLLRLTTAKCDPDSFDVNVLIEELTRLGGESIVAYKEDDIVKVHVHIFAPGDVLGTAHKYGEFLTVKIENMSLGHSDTGRVKKKKRKKLGTVAVVAGDGISALFKDMGADITVSGGQTANPSTEELISAFDKVNADSIIVLPNNKNVILAASQAAQMYTKSKVYIVPTRSLMEGYGALSVITEGVDNMEALVESAVRAANGVVGSEITKAVRDVTIDGKEIKKGKYIAITNDGISAVSETRNGALLNMLDTLDMDDYEIITLFTGADVDDDARVEITEILEEKYPDHEIVVHIGDQELYDYLMAVE